VYKIISHIEQLKNSNWHFITPVLFIMSTPICVNFRGKGRWGTTWLIQGSNCSTSYFRIPDARREKVSQRMAPEDERY
jgi:hypothetical protein